MRAAEGKESRNSALASEAVLLRRWKAGDEDAFNKLVHENMPVIERLALQLTHDPNLAEDIVANALIRAYRSGKNFNGCAQFKTWMHRIVVNCVLDERRKTRHPWISLDELHDEDDGSIVQMQLADPDPSPLEVLLRNEEFARIEDSVERLDEDHQSLVKLFHAKGLGYADIAAQRSIPVGTIKSRLHRARQAIAERLQVEESRAKRDCGRWAHQRAS